MIAVKHLTKRYGSHLAISDLNFTIEAGSVYGFLGPNGAGKSTTMNIITGCLGTTEGEVTIGGYSVFEEPAKAKAAPAKAGKEGKAAQPVAGKKAVPAKADGKTTATAKAPVKTKAEQPKAATQTAKTTATAPAKAAQTQKPAQNSKASAKAPTNSAPVKARATQAKSEKAALKQPAKTAQQKSGK